MSFEELDNFSEALQGVPNTPMKKEQGTDLKDDFDLFEDETVDPPAGDDPAGGDDPQPTGDDPTGDDPAGDDPAGDEPTGDDDKFYDAKRDYPDEDVVPTSYADRVAASQGIVHKFNYLQKLGKDLESVGSSFGAIDLPSIVGDDLSKIEELQDLAKVAELSDEEAKKAIFELDKTINTVKSKYERVKSAYESQQQQQQMDAELVQAQDTAREAVELLGVKIDENTTDNDLIIQAEKSLEKFIDKADDYVDEHGAKEYTKALKQHEKAVADIKKYIDVSYKKAQQSESGQSSKPTAEQIESWYEEFRGDNPNLAIFKAPTEEAETAFLQYVKRQGFELNGPRSFKTAYAKYDAFLQDMRAKKQVQKATQKNNQNAPANRKPTAIPVVSSNQSADKPLADQIDADMDNLLKEAFR